VMRIFNSSGCRFVFWSDSKGCDIKIDDSLSAIFVPYDGCRKWMVKG
jgi:hypothetical protein